MAKLCIVPTPIGNLEDITLRALRMLKQSDLILAEDTRVTRILLSHFDIHKKLISFHTNNEHAQLQEAIRQIEAHEQVALVSDAGTPGISDPGFLLVRACIEQGIEVERQGGRQHGVGRSLVGGPMPAIVKIREAEGVGGHRGSELSRRAQQLDNGLPRHPGQRAAGRHVAAKCAQEAA